VLKDLLVFLVRFGISAGATKALGPGFVCLLIFVPSMTADLVRRY
jgi:hypothetical protein